jgi:hypothetical protein
MPMLMQATDDGAVCYITSPSGLGLVQIPHVKVFHFFHGI